MPLTTFNNGESNASVRTKINNCITQVNDLINNPYTIDTPSVIYVTTSGNDTTGDGTLANPFLTPAAAFALATTLAVNVIVDFGVGSFVYTSSSSWPNFVAGVRGQGPLTNLSINIVSSAAVQITADSLSLTVSATGPSGAVGSIGNGNGEVNGGAGGQGSPSPNITILGSCTVSSVFSNGGAGGEGGQGVGSTNGEEQGTGGTGGTGGDCTGTILIRCPNIIGTIGFNPGAGGIGGQNAYGGATSDGAAGSANGSTFISDGCYMVGSTQTNVTSWKAGRCSYSAGTPTTDFGGNAIIS
jgi:hypothetical protein